MDSQERLRLLVQRTWQLTALLGVAFTAVASATGTPRSSAGATTASWRRTTACASSRWKLLAASSSIARARPLVENVPSYFLLLDRGRSASRGLEPRVPGSHARASAGGARTHPRGLGGQASYVPLVMAEDLTLDQVARLEAAALEHPEFEIEVQPAPLLPPRHADRARGGLPGEAGARARSAPDLHAGDLVGVKGVEQTYDSILRGTDGRRVVVVDSRGKFVHEELREASLPGGNLELTLDLELQQEAERFFADRVGSAVALDPRNGEILAMVSAPSFNPNVFARRLDRSDWRAIVDAPHQPLQNRAMQNTYPPGLGVQDRDRHRGLEEGVDPADSVSCGGATRVYNHRFRCWKKGGHGRVDMRARDRALVRRLLLPPRRAAHDRPDRRAGRAVSGWATSPASTWPGRSRGSFPIASGVCASAAPCGSRARQSRCRSARARSWSRRSRWR